MDGLCLPSGNLGCPLCRTARRACKHNFPVLCLKGTHQHIRCRRLSRTRSAREDHHARIKPAEHRLPLLFREAFCVFNRPEKLGERVVA